MIQKLTKRRPLSTRAFDPIIIIIINNNNNSNSNKSGMPLKKRLERGGTTTPTKSVLSRHFFSCQDKGRQARQRSSLLEEGVLSCQQREKERERERKRERSTQ